MKSYIGRSTILAAAVLLALVTTSCASTSPDTNTQNDRPAATDGNGNSNAEQPAADFVSEELDGALVGSFPKEVPLYDGQIESSSASLSEASGDPQWSVRITTSDPFETVDAAIRAAFSSNGWKIASEMKSGSTYLTIARGGGPTTTVSYNDTFGTIDYGVGG